MLLTPSASTSVIASIYRGVTVSKSIDDARRLIQSRLSDIAAETRQLERAVASLGEGSASRRPAERRPRGLGVATHAFPKSKRRAGRRRKAAKRAARGQRREELLAAIRTTPGARRAELAKTIGISSTQVHALIAKARSDKLIVKKGDGYELKES